MTQNSAVKKAARARMAETGEKYTVARRKVMGGSKPPQPLAGIPVELEFPPESLTAVIGGGGMTNLGLVMPTLIRLAGEGHPVVIAAHEGTPSPWNLASPFDFLVAGGVLAAEDLAASWAKNGEKDRTLLRRLIDEHPISFAYEPQSTSSWISALTPSKQTGKAAILYVPDLQVDHPLSDWPSIGLRTSLSDFDLMPAQLAGLKSVAREAKAGVIGGHCMPARDVDGWRVVAEIADDSIVIDCSPNKADEGIYDARLDFHSRWAEGSSPVRTEHTQIDVRFDSWRDATMAHRRSES